MSLVENRREPWKDTRPRVHRAIRYPWKVAKHLTWRALTASPVGEHAVVKLATPASHISPGPRCSIEMLGQRDAYEVTVDGDDTIHIPDLANNATNLKQGTIAKLRAGGLTGDPMARRYELPGFVELHATDTVVDIGAYIGTFAAYATQRASTVHALEPHPTAYWCLTENTRDTDSIRTYDHAAWNRTTQTRLQAEVDSADTTISETTTGPVVNAMRLEDWAHQHDISSVDFLKIDAEGKELPVLDGIGDLDVHKIGVDAGEDSATNPREVEEWLLRRGYDVRRDGHLVYGRR